MSTRRFVRSNFGLGGPFALVLLVLVGVLRSGCTYDPPSGSNPDTPEGLNAILATAEVIAPSSKNRRVIVADTNGLRIEQGMTCAQPSRGATKRTLGSRVLDSAEIPKGYEGTVILNGWTMRFRNKEHHLQGLGAVIHKIHRRTRLGKRELGWEAAAILSDKNGDDPYEWCYAHTLLFWPKPRVARSAALGIGFDISVADFGPPTRHIFTDRTADGRDVPAGSDARIHRIKGDLPFLPDGPRPSLTILNGFATGFTGSDKHVLQVGHVLGVPRTKPTGLSWSSRTSLKDNGSPGFRSAEMLSYLGGGSIAYLQPPQLTEDTDRARTIANDWTLKARDKSPCPNAVLHQGAPGVTVHKLKVEVPSFAYAIPMLRGWDVGDICDDNHVGQIGVWLRDFRYVRGTGAQKPMLHFEVVSEFTDWGDGILDSLGSRVDLKIGVLGIKGGSVPAAVLTR